MFLGFVAIALGLGLLNVASNGPTATKFKQEHPVASLALIGVSALGILYLLDGVVVFLLGILLPFSGNYCFAPFTQCYLIQLYYLAIFIHASLRLRNLRNKLTNKMEQLGFKKSTPMGMLLDACGIEPIIVD